MSCLTALLAALIVPCAAVHSTDVQAAPPGHLRVAIGTTTQWPRPADALEHQVVVLNAWDEDRLAALKTGNPNVKVLLYKNFAAARAAAATGQSSTGVPLEEARPEWYLRDPEGDPIRFRNYPSLYAMDIGSTSYQEYWADNVIRELHDTKFDGVFMDDVNLTMRYHYSGRIPSYPTDSDYQRAVESALAAIAPRIRAAGKLAYANIGSWSETDAFANTGIDWSGYLTGAMEENFVKWPQSYAAEVRWHRSLGIAKAVQRQGRHFLAITTPASNADRAAARYGWATALLAAQGRIAFAAHANYNTEVRIPEYSYSLGRPVTESYADQGGVERRWFARGQVLVNPTESTRSVSLGGRFSGSGLTDATSAAMSPKTALIVVKSRTVRRRHGRRQRARDR